ncbi:MAG: hypothetical protein LBK23_11675 [Oscillospiraceae bacterium]|jgi:hypothetical protein|nr:hypothetical protein [Oscillospiraceae bacterium]
MYEGLGIRFTKERKKLSRKAIVVIIIAGVLVASALGYVAFWNIKISAPFDKFYGDDTITFDHAGAIAKPASGYKVSVLKPFIFSFGASIGYVSIEQTEGPVSVWFNLDALTDEIIYWNIGVDISPIERNGIIWSRSVGFQLDKEWRAYAYPPESTFTNGKSEEGKTPQEYADENRAGIQKMFDEIERRWGYEFPPPLSDGAQR